MSGLFRLAGGLKTDLPFSGFKLGKIEKILEPGRFVVVLENGSRVAAQGARTLKINSRVRVFPPGEISAGVKGESEPPASPLKGSGTQWRALLPLGFGGEKASARLRVFVEEKTGGLWNKNPRAAYFVVWTHTEKLGELQWSIYLKGREVSLQVFAKNGIDDKDGIRDLAANVEKSLKSRGFTLAAPTVYLGRPFKAPEGFRLNVRG